MLNNNKEIQVQHFVKRSNSKEALIHLVEFLNFF